ncbi:YgaP family membrane protein [Halochromatium roseum]|uniref:YgaP family membrane protein n=1 Tax=Halochromatium roseum TaxID=391920 RepID=UPI0019129E0D|nr:DUF2892 domain-containing protein [Halochromatium roseum]MBK5937824.1 hypothetical protein [Halochromatium roseum]
MNMTKNIGDTDRNIRFAAGVAIALWGLIDHNLLGLIGLVLVGTAYMRSCPVYSAMNMDTTGK